MTYNKHLLQLGLSSAAMISIFGMGLSAVNAQTIAASGTASASSGSTQQPHLATIISKGDAEIERRLTTLSSLSARVGSATKLTSSDKTTLTTEVSGTQSGLTVLKGQLDSQTTVAGAAVYAEDIFANYRVYALVVPKVDLIKTADDEQVTSDQLTILASKLQTRLASYSGTNKTTLQSDLSDLTTNATTAKGLANGIETTVINLAPTDYNSNHAVLSGDAAKLKVAHGDNVAAYKDAQTITAALKA